MPIHSKGRKRPRKLGSRAPSGFCDLSLIRLNALVKRNLMGLTWQGERAPSESAPSHPYARRARHRRRDSPAEPPVASFDRLPNSTEATPGMASESRARQPQTPPAPPRPPPRPSSASKGTVALPCLPQMGDPADDVEGPPATGVSAAKRASRLTSGGLEPNLMRSRPPRQPCRLRSRRIRC
jgi:hypothetical protein